MRLAIIEALRRRGGESAQGSERYVGAVVRGSALDWLTKEPAEEKEPSGRDHSTVTHFARFRGWSTSVPFSTAT